MKKTYLLVIVLVMLLFGVFLIFKIKSDYIKRTKTAAKTLDVDRAINEANYLLENREDKLASIAFKRILAKEPQNISALWGEAEILRRQYKYKDSEKILQEILKREPKHIPSLVSLCYIRFQEDKLDEAMKMAKNLLDMPDIDTRNKAIVYMLIGSINARKAARGGLFSKITYGTQIKGYFEKAVFLAPNISESHLGLGTFYLKAPGIAGGNIDKAISELELAVKITPKFATANARLAEAYKKKGDTEKYNYYIQRAKELDPENEALAEALK